MQFLEKLWKMLENIEILNLASRKEKKLFDVRAKLSYYKFFHINFISNRNEKTKILVNKAVHLGLSILELRKIFMYEFWHDYVKQKYNGKAKLWIQIVSLYT